MKSIDLCSSTVTALVLAGGESVRMGVPKHSVPLLGKPLIEHVLRILEPAFDNIYVVTKNRAALDHLPVPLIEDLEPHRGPLVGLYSGLVTTQADWCFLVGCDMPFLAAPVIQYMARCLDGGDIVVPRVTGRLQPLHAFYSSHCIPKAKDLLDQGSRSLRALIATCPTDIVGEVEIARLDPELHSFIDLDTLDQVSHYGQKEKRTWLLP